jgi:putative ABC transport system substrate-binding protein
VLNALPAVLIATFILGTLVLASPMACPVAAQPPTPIRDISTVAGVWEATFALGGAPVQSFTWTIGADGSWQTSPQPHTGTMTVRDGMLVYRNATTGRTGRLALYDEPRGRVLRGGSDDGTFTFELRPASRQITPSLFGVPRIGVLATNPIIDAFRQAMAGLGYVHGKNAMIEYREAIGRPEALGDLAAELLRLKVDVILASSTPAAQAARRVTATVPIVFLSIDPVGAGLVGSLARPGANLTGVSAISPDLTGKRLELLLQAVPAARRIAVLFNPTHAAADAQLRELRTAAVRLGLEVSAHEVRANHDLEGAFAAMAARRVDALLVVADPVLLTADTTVAALALRHRVPAVAEHRNFAHIGGLLTYGPNYFALLDRAAVYVDRILKGAKPADLPVEQPSTFELVVNLKTAKALGVAIPAALLLRADHVID